MSRMPRLTRRPAHPSGRRSNDVKYTRPLIPGDDVVFNYIVSDGQGGTNIGRVEIDDQLLTRRMAERVVPLRFTFSAPVRPEICP